MCPAFKGMQKKFLLARLGIIIRPNRTLLPCITGECNQKAVYMILRVKKMDKLHNNQQIFLDRNYTCVRSACGTNDQEYAGVTSMCNGQ